MEYNFKHIETKWQKLWEQRKTYQVEVDNSRPKFYVLDMFPYPSGAGKQRKDHVKTQGKTVIYCKRQGKRPQRKPILPTS